MITPRRLGHAPFSIVMLATIPMVLAAITVLMFRDALVHAGARTPAAASIHSPPAPNTP